VKRLVFTNLCLESQFYYRRETPVSPIFVFERDCAGLVLHVVGCAPVK